MLLYIPGHSRVEYRVVSGIGQIIIGVDIAIDVLCRSGREKDSQTFLIQLPAIWRAPLYGDLHAGLQ
jgi:hypothetical protein